MYIAPLHYVNCNFQRYLWLGDVTVKCGTCDREVVGSTPSRVTIKWLLLGWATVCGQVNHLGIYNQRQCQLNLPFFWG